MGMCTSHKSMEVYGRTVRASPAYHNFMSRWPTLAKVCCTYFVGSNRYEYLAAT